jgi:hypothetical protein
MYNGLSGGARFPSPMAPPMGTAPVYTANIDPNVVTFNAAGELVPIKWMAVLGNLHYHLPFGGGRMFRVSVIGSFIKSSNIVEAHDFLSATAIGPAIWKQKVYGDANFYWAMTPATQLSFSGQWAQQTWADDEKSTNIRGEVNFHFFF